MPNTFQAESIEAPRYIPSSTTVDKMHFKECLIEMFQVKMPTLSYTCFMYKFPT